MTTLEGLPSQYEAVRWGLPKKGEEYLRNSNGAVVKSDADFDYYHHLIVRKIEPPLQLRDGGWYESRGGDVLGPTKAAIKPASTYAYSILNVTYDSNGVCLNSYESLDLIREVPAPQAEPAKEATVDPGEGWRLLDEGEPTIQGDECKDRFGDGGEWATAIAWTTGGKQVSSCIYRRRIEAQPQPEKSYAERQAKWVAEHGVKVGTKLRRKFDDDGSPVGAEVTE